MSTPGSYEWAARASDDTDTSDWRGPCRFTVDVAPPAVEPGVSSADYPENCPFPFCGGMGIPGRFTFAANGVADVAGYTYGTSEPVTFVPADHLGGDATITVAPRGPGLNTLVVRSVDRAGNPSPRGQYTYFVRDTRPIVSCVPEHGGLGEPRECTFAPGMPGVISYRYRFDNGPEVTIPANSDGVATVTLRPVNPFSPPLDVTSITADGFETTLNFFIFVAPSAPEATSDTYPQFDYGGGVGVTGEFRFSPKMPNVAEYVYQFDDDPEIVVPADPDGSAVVSYTPASPEGHFLQVRSRTADGVTSLPTHYFFLVNPTG